MILSTAVPKSFPVKICLLRFITFIGHLGCLQIQQDCCCYKSKAKGLLECVLTSGNDIRSTGIIGGTMPRGRRDTRQRRRRARCRGRPRWACRWSYGSPPSPSCSSRELSWEAAGWTKSQRKYIQKNTGRRRNYSSEETS